MVKSLALDTETTGLFLLHGCKPFMVTACDNDWNTWMFEWEVNPINREPIYTPKTVKQLITLIEQYDELVFHNYSFDIKALWLIDDGLKKLVTPDNFKIHDTKVQSHIRNSNEPHGLKLQAVKYLRKGMKDEEHLHKIVVAARRVAKQYEVYDDNGKLHPIDIARAGHPHLPNVTKEFPMCDFWLPAALHRLGLAPDDSWATACAQYGTRDAERTQALHQVGIEAILSQKNTRAVYDREMALAPALLEMETTGTTLHKKNFNEALGSTIHDLDQGLTEVKRLAKFLGKPDLNPNSGQQLQKLIYGDFKLKPLTYTKSGNPSTDAENLEHHIKVLSVQSNLSRRKQTFRKFLTELIAYKRLKTASTYLNNYAGFRIDNTLYPSLDQTGTRTTRFSSSNPNGQNICFDGDTELLTTEGWVKAEHLTYDHRVAEFWAEEETINFVHPTRLYSPHFTGMMQHITTDQGIDMLLTPNHRCLLQNRKTLGKIVVKADEFRSDYRHLNAGVYVGGKQTLSDAEVTWLCAVQADGSYTKANGSEYGIQFVLKKQRKIDRLRECMISLNVLFTEKQGDDSVAFYVGKYETQTLLAKRLMPSKRFGPWLLDLDRKTIDKFTDEVLVWDGDYTRRSVYSSSDKENADWVQILWSLSGKRASISSRMPKGWAKRPHHYVNVTHGKNYSLTTNHTRKDVPWDGPVYCVSVPSTYVVTRRNGKVSVTGNSKGHEEEDELSGTKVRKLNLRTVFGPRRGRQWIAIDYSQLQLRIFAFLSQEQSLQDAFDAGWDFHTFVACRIFNTDNPSDLQRRIAKNVNFALIFGAGQAKVDATAGMPGAYDLFRSQFPSVDRYMSSLIRQTRRTGVVWTAGGYPLRIPKDRAYACVNYAVQGTEGDIVKDALHKTHSFIRNDEQYNDVRLILTVHDELLFESPTSVQFPVDPICEIMENAGLALGMTTPVEASLIRKSWDAKEDVKRQLLAV